jgi:hypothetical protein
MRLATKIIRSSRESGEIACLLEVVEGAVEITSRENGIGVDIDEHQFSPGARGAAFGEKAGNVLRQRIMVREDIRDPRQHDRF